MTESYLGVKDVYRQADGSNNVSRSRLLDVLMLTA